MTRPITGYHVFAMFALGFGIIISVNIALAWNAVRTFPGLEVKNSYVASQQFDADRAAQTALGWEARAVVRDGTLWVSFVDGDTPVRPAIEKAIFGRATYAGEDQVPEFVWTGAAFSAPVTVTGGNYNLRIEARADDGTLFRQRMIVEMVQ